MGTMDLTEGRIGRQLILFFLPIAAGTLFQQLYNAADAVIVGKFVGTVALAAIFTVLLWIVPAYILWTYIEIISGILRGVGDAVIPVIILGVGIALFRVLWIAIAFKL